MMRNIYYIVLSIICLFTYSNSFGQIFNSTNAPGNPAGNPDAIINVAITDNGTYYSSGTNEMCIQGDTNNGGGIGDDPEWLVNFDITDLELADFFQDIEFRFCRRGDFGQSPEVVFFYDENFDEIGQIPGHVCDCTAEDCSDEPICTIVTLNLCSISEQVTDGVFSASFYTNGDISGNSVGDYCDIVAGPQNDGDAASCVGNCATQTQSSGGVFQNQNNNGPLISSACNNCNCLFVDYVYVPKNTSPDKDNDGVVDADDEDSDNDGILNIDEGVATNLDTDGDLIPDYLDLDSDNDGIADAIEACGDISLILENCMLDSNGNGSYVDSDGDGCIDGYIDNINTCGNKPIDTDSDGTPDFQDLDSDDDGAPDAVEACTILNENVNLTTFSANTVDPCGIVIDQDNIIDCIRPDDNDYINPLIANNEAVVFTCPPDNSGLPCDYVIPSGFNSIVDFTNSGGIAYVGCNPVSSFTISYADVDTEDAGCASDYREIIRTYTLSDGSTCTQTFQYTRHIPGLTTEIFNCNN